MLALFLIVGSVCTAATKNITPPLTDKSSQVQITPIGTGFYEFRSNVEGASVFLDDQEIGTIQDGIIKTPVQVFEKPLNRQLRIQAAGYSTYTETLVQSPKVDETIIVRGTLQLLPINLTGTLSLAVSPPGSTVSIDNVTTGVVSQSGIMTLRSVNSGNRMVKVTLPGYKDSLQQVYVEPNLETKLRIQLSPVTTGTLDITSTPSGAEVLINGSPYGITPVNIPDLENGSYTVGLSLPGYQGAQSEVILNAGQRVPVSINLQPIPTATPTQVPTTSQATPTPTPTQAGFSPVIIIAGLLGAGVLAIKKK